MSREDVAHMGEEATLQSQKVVWRWQEVMDVSQEEVMEQPLCGPAGSAAEREELLGSQPACCCRQALVILADVTVWLLKARTFLRSMKPLPQTNAVIRLMIQEELQV